MTEKVGGGILAHTCPGLEGKEGGEKTLNQQFTDSQDSKAARLGARARETSREKKETGIAILALGRNPQHRCQSNY